MKSILAVISMCIALSACAPDCEEKTVVVEPVQKPVIVQPEPVVEVPVCDNSTFTNCTPPEGMELCDVSSYNPCANPTWIPKQPSVTSTCPQGSITCKDTPLVIRDPVVQSKPVITCHRDSTPLIDVNGFLVDNCGNKYGKTN